MPFIARVVALTVLLIVALPTASCPEPVVLVLILTVVALTDVLTVELPVNKVVLLAPRLALNDILVAFTTVLIVALPTAN